VHCQPSNPAVLRSVAPNRRAPPDAFGGVPRLNQSCEYRVIHADILNHMGSAHILQFLLIASLAITAFGRSNTAHAELTYPDVVSSFFDKEDEPSARNGYKKCEVSLTMMKGGEGVDLRAKILSDGKVSISSITVDVFEFTISNGIPYAPKRKSISSAKVVSNVFETTPVMRQVDMGDGGWGIMLDRSGFTSLTKLIERGDLLVAFKRNDSSNETVYAVREGVDKKVLGQFLSCVQRI
jgi:hypothetical protein